VPEHDTGFLIDVFLPNTIEFAFRSIHVMPSSATRAEHIYERGSEPRTRSFHGIGFSVCDNAGKPFLTHPLQRTSLFPEEKRQIPLLDDLAFDMSFFSCFRSHTRNNF
jgi:hypothetical protein